MKITFKQQFDKLTEQYIQGLIKPYNNEFCMCGNLCNGNVAWRERPEISQYSIVELLRVEKALLYTLRQQIFGDADMPIPLSPMYMRYFTQTDFSCDGIKFYLTEHPQYEDALFDAMVAALNELRDIHIEHGEDVDEVILPKRLTLNPQI